jgi:CheY-like chemotaxis protein
VSWRDALIREEHRLHAKRYVGCKVAGISACVAGGSDIERQEHVMLSKIPSTRTNDAGWLVPPRRTRPSPAKFSEQRLGVLPSPVVVVVSEDSLLRWALYEALAAAHFRVLTLRDEADALELLPKVDVELALLVLDHEAWPMTRAGRDWLHGHWPHLPILVLAQPGEDLEHRLRELDVDEVLVKPFDVSRLVQTVEHLIAVPVRVAHHANHLATH